MRTLTRLLLALAAACGGSTREVDACAGQNGTCVALQLDDASPSIGAINGVEIAISGDVIQSGNAVFPDIPGKLPVAVAVLLPDAGGSFAITAAAVRGGVV